MRWRGHVCYVLHTRVFNQRTQATIEHATSAIRAHLPSPADGIGTANVGVAKAEDWARHAEHIAEARVYLYI